MCLRTLILAGTSFETPLTYRNLSSIICLRTLILAGTSFETPLTYREPVLDHLLEDLDLGGRHWVFVLEHGAVLLRQRVEVRLVPDQEDRYNETNLSSTVTVLSCHHQGFHVSASTIFFVFKRGLNSSIDKNIDADVGMSRRPHIHLYA